MSPTTSVCWAANSALRMLGQLVPVHGSGESVVVVTVKVSAAAGAANTSSANVAQREARRLIAQR